MVESVTKIFAESKADNYEDLVESGGLGDVADLLARIWPILVNSRKSSSVIFSKD
jgi:hypothetical protein